MIEFNYDDEVVSSPAVIVSGRTNTLDKGVIQFVNNDNKVFPKLSFEVNNFRFKALLHISPNEENKVKATFWKGATLDNSGNPANMQKITEEGGFTLRFNPLPENKPVHLCVIVGKDSKGAYDMPKYKLDRGEKANLDTTVQRLKVAGRMMQAFTQDDFHNLKLGNRSFQFVEESTKSQKVFGISQKGSVAHTEVKIHVLQSPKTMAELRDPDWAQQNPTAKEEGGLFRHAIEIIYASNIFKSYKRNNTAIQCAVMVLDSTWNGSLITGHTGMGGGSDEVRLAIFGSHGLHSFPLTFPQMTPCFSDETALSTTEVANDSNQCGTPWECLNICMGAFMHEFGYMFGSALQAKGIMLRDYIWWNRLFMTREFRCLRDNSPGKLIGAEGKFAEECHWGITDITRFLYHGSFSIPLDLNDSSFTKTNSTLMKPGDVKELPILKVENPGQVTIKSTEGIYLVEFLGENLSRHHIKFHPKSFGGPGAPLEVSLNFEDCLREFRKTWKESAEDFDLRVLSTGGEIWEPDFKFRSYSPLQSVMNDEYSLGKGWIDGVKGIKGKMWGTSEGQLWSIEFDMTRLFKVRVYHILALEGIAFYSNEKKQRRMSLFGRKCFKRQWWRDSNPYKNDDGGVPDEEESTGVGNDFAEDNDEEKDEQRDEKNGLRVEKVVLGSVTTQYTDFLLLEGENIIKFSCRGDTSINAIGIETDWGRNSGMIGGLEGSIHTLMPPTAHKIVGMYGYADSDLLYGLGIIYAHI